MIKKRTPKIQNLAKIMRHNSTNPERILWHHLRDKFPHIHFRRQYQIDKYIVDFVALKNKLILECDGGQHSKEKDKARDLFLQNQGYKVLHIWNIELLKNLNGILNLIYEHLENK